MVGIYLFIVILTIFSFIFLSVRSLKRTYIESQEEIMSAIAGIYHLNGEPVSSEHKNGIMKGLEHYPANDIQTLQKENIFLGCHAQWITPESVNEVLPYYDYESQMMITSDAIIDNRGELFSKLDVDTYRRNGIPDSLLILLAYQKWGEDCPKYLIGDFAFMIWDEKNQKLFGARDFSGGRTLYYYSSFSKFAFCTTINPLLDLPYVSRELNKEWIAEFLVIKGMVDVADTSITPYKHIKQLPPAHSITVTKGNVILKRYPYLNSSEKLLFKSNEEYVEAFQDVFQEAVKSRIRTYKKVGSQLSGGLDSGSIVSFAARELRKEDKQLHTFSYLPASDFSDYTASHVIANEKPYIKSTVEFVGDLKDYYFDFKERSAYSEIDNIMHQMEIPFKFYVNSFWLKGMFEEANKRDIGVLLNGGRGNLSISWGDAFPYYATLLKQLKWKRLLDEINQFSLNVGSGRKKVLSSVVRHAFPILQGKSGNSSRDLPLISPIFAESTKIYEKLSMFGLDMSGRSILKDPKKLREDHFNQLFNWNASNTLATKLSLSHSLWKRDPTNDLRVIRFCMALPDEQYVQNGLNRALIRRSTKNFLPDQVRLNMKVRGVQGVDWVHRMIPRWKEFKDEVDGMCKDKEFLEIVNGQKLHEASAFLEQEIKPEHAYSSHLKTLMDSLVVYRFLKLEGR
jgi:asparagine synthase (glutamine-hydrolysing)